jgi:outer membrane protein OmpA-like peptidoglycan-associated protein
MRYIKYIWFVVFFIANSACYAQFKVGEASSIDSLVRFVLLDDESNVLISNIQYSGNQKSIGHFQNASIPELFNEGIILTSGSIHHITSHNLDQARSYNTNTKGNELLTRIASGQTTNAAVLSFDFVPFTDTIVFYYIFGSEEYPEFVEKEKNDVFAFFISQNGDNPVNIAKIEESGIPITIDNVNSQNHSELFIKNYIWDLNYSFLSRNPQKKILASNLEYDGITTKLPAKYAVKPGRKYHIDLAIADVDDYFNDSGVFLKAGSFKSSGQKKIFVKSVIERYLVDFEDKYQNIKVKKDSANPGIQIFYKIDSFDLTQKKEAYLSDILSFIQSYPQLDVMIYGHTDETGTTEYNQKLSAQRAAEVANYFIAQDISSKRISFKGFGSAKPLNDKGTNEAKAMNRRVEVFFKYNSH